MMMYRLALCAAVVLVAAGCGSTHHHAMPGMTTVLTSTVPTTTVQPRTPAVQPACRRLNGAARQAVSKIGGTLNGFKGISSVGQLSQHATALRAQISAQSARIGAVQTPPGPLTADKQRLVAALQQLQSSLATAQQAAKQGKVGTAARDFGALAQLRRLRRATGSLARDCPTA